VPNCWLATKPFTIKTSLFVTTVCPLDTLMARATLQNQQKLFHNWYSFIAWPTFFRAIAGKI
jgi:hypothetical protein